MALDAQAALLPYALIFFAVGLAMFAWASSFAANGQLMIVSLAIFAINWGGFYALATTVRRKPELSRDPVARTRIQVLGALLWAAAIAQISVFALGAGPARESLLILACAGAMACFFFLAPVLPALLFVGPAACAGPLICLYLTPGSRELASFTSGALALGMTLSLLVNRILERQFSLSADRERLALDCEAAAWAAGQLAKSKSALIATLSSEVRNGLAGVTHVLAAAAGLNARSAPSREQLKAALEAARDLAEVLDATLDTENAEAGRLVVETRPFDGAALARDLVYLCQPQAAAKGLELSVFVEDDLSTGAMLGDPLRTRQVLANLIGNALKFTTRGRVEVRMRREGADRARFEIADTGPGLSPDELDAAFAPFARIERVSAGVAGAGLGLSLARSLAHLMGGEIGAVSALGAGSCFWLDLPYDAEAMALPDSSASPVQARSLLIMTVLDNRLGAASLRATLEALGHQVIHAQGADRAVELLKTCRVDVIVVGTAETAGQVGAACDETPMLALTDGEAEMATACLAAGCAGVVRPPVVSTAVARALAMLLRDGQLAAANAA